MLLRGEVQAAIEDAYRKTQPAEESVFQRLPDDVEEAAVSIEAALLTLQPDYYKRELAFETDADERIAKAAHLEYLEARREEMRDTNEFHRLVSDASKKIRAIEASNGATAGLVSRLIGNLNESNAVSGRRGARTMQSSVGRESPGQRALFRFARESMSVPRQRAFFFQAPIVTFPQARRTPR